ncbi:MAG: hypothetical protein KDD41_05500 [Flavobacteriales bacterium]|nr:hypothetical protein [Flavobacteriales bacterium]
MIGPSVRKLILFCLLTVFIQACSPELVRVDFSKHQTAEIKIPGKQGEVVDLYIDFDLEFDSLPDMVMEFEFYQGNLLLFKGGIDPLAVLSPEREFTEENGGGKIHWTCYGKLQGDFSPPADTLFTVRSTLVMNQAPGLKINKFELVLVR